MHLVHYSSAYSNVSDAMNETLGLAVLGVFMQVGYCHNIGLLSAKMLMSVHCLGSLVGMVCVLAGLGIYSKV